MLSLSYKHHLSNFIRPGGTSRGILRQKSSWILKLTDLDTGISGFGEISIIGGLSPENEESIRSILDWLQSNLQKPKAYLLDYLSLFPAAYFGIEMAFDDLENGGKQLWYPSAFTAGQNSLPTNGLIWMNSIETMKKDLQEKLEKGFRCLKIKIGAIDIADELRLVSLARNFSDELIIRLDANGAFNAHDALATLQAFAEFNIHSIEQPVKPGQPELMAKLCAESPIPIALDEELIGVHQILRKEEVLKHIKPQYIILKPSLAGGFKGSDEWIEIAQSLNINWWATSALETNLGLNAIAQWVGSKNPKIHQGLGTGQVFSNNFEGPLQLIGEQLHFNPSKIAETPFS